MLQQQKKKKAVRKDSNRQAGATIITLRLLPLLYLTTLSATLPTLITTSRQKPLHKYKGRVNNAHHTYLSIIIIIITTIHPLLLCKCMQYHSLYLRTQSTIHPDRRTPDRSFGYSPLPRFVCTAVRARSIIPYFPL